MERRLLAEDLTPDLLLRAKRLGFSDEQVGTLADMLPERVRAQRQDWDIKPVYKMVDTCAAEFEAVTPYYYSTYDQENEAEPLLGRKAVVIGSGPIRIGQGIEFDYCSVHAAWALSEAGVSSVMINSNPETVSTDFDTSDRLYFEPLDEEAVRDVIDNETIGDDPPPSVVQFGRTDRHHPLPVPRPRRTAHPGFQRPGHRHRLGPPQVRGVHVPLGNPSTPRRRRGIRRGGPAHRPEHRLPGGRPAPATSSAAGPWKSCRTPPSSSATSPPPPRSPTPRGSLVDHYMEGKECEVDAICDGHQVLIPGIMEHIERAGVHSGDSMAIYPGLNLTPEEVETLVEYTTRIGLALGVKD